MSETYARKQIKRKERELDREYLKKAQEILIADGVDIKRYRQQATKLKK